MSSLPLQTLERANFHPDSNESKSTRFVKVDNSTDEPVNVVVSDQTKEEQRHEEMMAFLREILAEMKTIKLLHQIAYENYL